jgi:hypothetical protein
MSWNGFVKAVSRATTSVMQSTGMVEKTVDRAWEEEERRFLAYEERVDKLHKEARAYLDAVRAMTLAQRRIAEAMEVFPPDSPLGVASNQYKFAAEKIDDEARAEMDAVYRTTVLEPLGKLLGVFPDFHEGGLHLSFLRCGRCFSSTSSPCPCPLAPGQRATE